MAVFLLVLDATEDEFEQFAATWENQCPALVATWRRSWPEFTSFLDFPLAVRKLIYATNRIESLNARFRKQSGGAGISSMSSCPARSSKAHRLCNPAPRRFIAEDSTIARDGLRSRKELP